MLSYFKVKEGRPNFSWISPEEAADQMGTMLPSVGTSAPSVGPESCMRERESLGWDLLFLATFWAIPSLFQSTGYGATKLSSSIVWSPPKGNPSHLWGNKISLAQAETRGGLFSEEPC